MESPKISSLPTSLILLVHLHILEYPNANSSEYDENLFHPRTRGLRERAKTMEDIAYFLVGRIEGKGVKAILPSYPCSQPSESVAFKTSLTKYLEAIRHRSIYPSSGKPTLKTSTKGSNSALWWKDVVVRKSLIEECSGKKFERLMVSLSTHALMSISSTIATDDMIKLLHAQPFTYTNALARYQQRRRVWTKAASTLLRSESDLKSFQSSFQHTSPSRYAAFSTEGLRVVAESKRQGLLKSQWGGEGGQAVFFFLLELAGLQSPSAWKSFSLDITEESTSRSDVVPSPLPIAAAHHPGHLKRLRRPIFDIPPKSKIQNSDNSTSQRSHAEIVLSEKLDSEKRFKQTLSEALSRIKSVNLQLRAKLEQIRVNKSAATETTEIKLWTRPASSYHSINLDPMPGKDLALSLGLELGHLYDFDDEDDDSKEKALEERIKQIRESILPPYPSVPDQYAPRKPAPDQEAPAQGKGSEKLIGKSKIPLAKLSAATRDHRLQEARPADSTAAGSSWKSNFDPPAKGVGTVPIPPVMTPAKSSRSDRRKSVRFSMAKRRTERLSMFGLFSDGLDDEVTRLIDETNDFPTDDEDTDADDNGFVLPSLKTPTSKSKGKKPVPNRIWTVGTPSSATKAAQNTPRARVPSALTRMVDAEGPVGLPSLPTSSSVSSLAQMGMDVYHAAEDEDEDEDGTADINKSRPADMDATPRPSKKKQLPRQSSPVALDVFDNMSENDEGEEEDVFGYNDPPSMTLKDILLSADVSHFNLLDASTEEIGEGMLVDDASFVWE